MINSDKHGLRRLQRRAIRGDMKGAEGMKERVKIDAKLCRQVELMMRGGATQEETAQMTGISATTVSRIKAAGYDAVQFMANNDRRRIMEKDRNADKVIEQIMKLKEEAEERKAMQEEGRELPGQMKLELVYDQSIAEEYKKEQEEKNDQTKMMRFYAAQIEKVLKKLDILIEEVQKIPLF